MSKIVYVALIVVGVVLLIYGLNASSSVSSSVSRAVSGTPTNRSIWLIVLGILGVIVGGLGAIFHRNT